MAVETAPHAAAVLFDEISTSYEQAYGENEALTKIFKRLAASHVPGSKILDVGCGPGGPASRLIAAGYNVTGIDVSQSMIDFCKKSFSGNFLKADMTKFESNEKFDAILSLLNLFLVSHTAIYSMIFKMASWLRPGGTLVLGVVAADDHIENESDLAKLHECPYVENYDLDFIGRRVPVTLLTAKEWLRILQSAGFLIQAVDRHEQQVAGFDQTEKQLYIMATRTHLEPLFGPYPLPAMKRSPHLLSKGAWKPFAERMTGHRFDAVLEAVKLNQQVLYVGSGHGELPASIAKQAGKAYAIEPNRDRNDLLVKNSSESPVEIHPGSAENLPFEENKFDAAVAVWILHNVDDLEGSLREMTRVVNHAAPNARIVIVQGAPDNEVVNLINKACAGIAEQSMPDGESAVDHQGLLLATAARVFAQHGFADIEARRIPAHCNFPEEDVSTRCQVAADVLTNFWYKDHPRAEDMNAAFKPILQEHFSSSPLEVDAHAVILIAKPKLAAGIHAQIGSRRGLN